MCISGLPMCSTNDIDVKSDRQSDQPINDNARITSFEGFLISVKMIRLDLYLVKDHKIRSLISVKIIRLDL